MTLHPFSFEVPDDLQGALLLLERHRDAAAFYMGGTELLLILKLGLSAAEVLVDGKRLQELQGITVDDNLLSIGAACTHREIESSDVVRRALPALASLAGTVGNARVRNVGTIGGNLCFAEPHSDPATLLTALGASVEVASTAGVRRLPLAGFYAGPLQTTLADSEIVTNVQIPLPEPRRSRVAFERIAFHERPVANAAVVADGDDVRIVVGAVGGVPMRVPAAEEAARRGDGRRAVADAVKAAVDPMADSHGSEGYKRHLAAVAVSRCLGRALRAA